MSVLKNLKSLFVVEEPDKQKKDSTNKTKNTPPKSEKKKASVEKKDKPSPESKVPLPENNPSLPPGQPEERFVEALLKSFEANNLQGFDYLEYKQSLEAMRKLNMDEATRYQSAFATASTMGVTLDQLLNTTQHYLTILGKEESKFQKALQQKNNESIVQKEEEFVQLEKIIQTKQEQIQQLQLEIEEHEKRRTDIQINLAEAKEKIGMTVNNFNASYESLRGQIENDIVKMQQYLK